MAVARYTRRIEWGDCDPAGIVFNPRYFEWFDAATADLFRQGGMEKHVIAKRFGIVIPLVETRAQFRRPLTWSDIAVIESRVTDYGRSSFKIEHQLKDAGNTLCVIGNEVRVTAAYDPQDKSKLKSAAIPSEVAAIFDRFKGE